MTKKKKLTEMTTRELANATREFDAENPGLRGRPLTPVQREWFDAARHAGRKRTGEGVKVISLSVEKGLLRLADAEAKREGLSRAQLVAQGLRLRLKQGRAWRR